MRQVSSINNPLRPKYGIIGNGRLSQHLQHYFTLLNLPFTLWHRSMQNTPENLLLDSDILLIALPDDSIDSFLEKHPTLNQKNCIHFSGAYISTHAYSYHPLMTFSNALYDLKTYQSLLFVGEKNTPDLQTFFPDFINPFIQINPKDKPYYHALCVMANNFTTLLWQKFFTQMQTTFNAPLSGLSPYLQQTLHNLEIEYQSALTGPLDRQDTTTIKANLQALEHDTFKGVYQAFIEAHTMKKLKTEKKEEYREPPSCKQKKIN